MKTARWSVGRRWTAGVMTAAFLFSAGGCHFIRSRPIDARTSMIREMTLDGIDSLRRGEAAQAERLLARAAEACPSDVRVRVEWSRALAKKGQVGAAIEQLRQAIALSDCDPGVRVELGGLYLQTGQANRALDEARAALERDRRRADAWLLRGRAERQLQQLAEARASLHRAAALDPRESAVPLELADVYLRLGAPQRAAVVLERAAGEQRRDDLATDFLTLQGAAWAAVGELERAVECWAAAAARDDARPEVLLELARVYQELGDTGNARLTLVRGRERFGERPEFGARLDRLASEMPQTAGVHAP